VADTASIGMEDVETSKTFLMSSPNLGGRSLLKSQAATNLLDFLYHPVVSQIDSGPIVLVFGKRKKSSTSNSTLGKVKTNTEN